MSWLLDPVHSQTLLLLLMVLTHLLLVQIGNCNIIPSSCMSVCLSVRSCPFTDLTVTPDSNLNLHFHNIQVYTISIMMPYFNII